MRPDEIRLFIQNCSSGQQISHPLFAKQELTVCSRRIVCGHRGVLRSVPDRPKSQIKCNDQLLCITSLTWPGAWYNLTHTFDNSHQAPSRVRTILDLPSPHSNPPDAAIVTKHVMLLKHVPNHRTEINGLPTDQHKTATCFHESPRNPSSSFAYAP